MRKLNAVKPFTWLGVLAGVGTALAVALGAFDDQASRRTVPEERYAFSDLKTRLADISTFSVSDGGKQFTLKRQDGIWLATSHDDVPIKTARINRFLIDLSDLKLIEPRTGKPELLPRLGLGDAAKRVTLSTPDTRFSLEVGKSAPGGPERYYLKVQDTAHSWIGGPLPGLAFTLRDWADLALPNISKARIARASITHGDGNNISMGREKPGDPITLFALKPDERPRYDLVADAMAGAFNYLTFEDVKATSSVDFSDAIRVTYECFDGLTLHIRFIKQGGKWWMHVAAQHQEQGDETKLRQLPDAPEDAKAELTQLQALASWAFSVPDYKVTEMVKRRADFLAEEETKDEEL